MPECLAGESAEGNRGAIRHNLYRRLTPQDPDIYYLREKRMGSPLGVSIGGVR